MTGTAETSTAHSQEILNIHWPAEPQAFSERTPSIPVRVRLVWEHDGEAFVEGWATKWDAAHVHVMIEDERTERSGVWVKPHDVYRRSPQFFYGLPDPPDF